MQCYAGETGYVHIRSGFAAALDSSLNAAGPSSRVVASSDGKGGDKRAQLIVELLLHASQGHLPTFTHMLLGFNIEDGAEGLIFILVPIILQGRGNFWPHCQPHAPRDMCLAQGIASTRQRPTFQHSKQVPTSPHNIAHPSMPSCAAGIHQSHLDPQQSYTCLSVILNALEAEWLPAAKPQLYAHMLELMHILAEDPLTSPSVLALLRHHAFFAHQLDTILCSQLPDEVWILSYRLL